MDYYKTIRAGAPGIEGKMLLTFHDSPTSWDYVLATLTFTGDGEEREQTVRRVDLLRIRETTVIRRMNRQLRRATPQSLVKA